MIKRLLALMVVACAIAARQDPPQDPAANVAKAVDGVVYQELTSLRVDTRLMVRAALAGNLEKLSPDQRFAKALGCIEGDMEKIHLAYLASDTLAGRCAGKPAERVATDYITDEFRRAGLKPAGDKNAKGEATYLQAVAGTSWSGEKVSTFNCLGLLEGSDPALKDEIVVIGGHHDHVGTAADAHPGRKGGPKGGDEIWNGADDNGSGATTIVTIARAFGALGVKPKRSILFMTFGGEEFGLVGSAYYVAHPTLPWEKTVAMINLDMVGRNPDDPCAVHGVGTADIFTKVVDDAAAATGLKVKKMDSPSLDRGDSDSSSFYKKGRGIPVLFFFTGFHDEYHTVSDHVDLIAFDHMAQVGRTAATIVWDLGNRADAPKLKSKAAAGKRALGVSLGVLADKDLDQLGLAADEGGLLIGEVVKDSVAEKAGLKKDDVLLSIDGKKLPRKDATAALKGAIPTAPAKTNVEVYREGKRLKISVDFGD